MALLIDIRAGQTADLFILRNRNGATMGITNFGARIVSLTVPDPAGNFADVVLGYDSAEEYLSHNTYYGAIIGRYGNRIAGGKFNLNGKAYSLAINNGENSLHGGPMGFHNVFWTLQPESKREDSIGLYYYSRDGEEGFPGNLSVKVVYTLSENNEVIIDYEARTDQSTIINLTSHAYFNLGGEGTASILGHSLLINAGTYMPVDPQLIPTGERRNVANSPFDFRTPHAIGARIGESDQQLHIADGYDHNWILTKKGNELSFAARATEPVSGRKMEVWTTEPGLQFYSGNFLEGAGADVGKGGKPYRFRSGFCLEAQHFPDGPNQRDFRSVMLQPEQVYTQQTIYRF